jgi:predicted O-methyltransferase YrrM
MNLFDNLKAITESPHGWTTIEKAKVFAGIILATRPSHVVEVGVWSGRGTIACALACKENGVGRVYGIDPYDASASSEGQTGKNLEWWSKQDHEAMYRYCLSQIEAFGVKDIAEIMRLRSDQVEPHTIPGHIGLLIVDGNHGPQAIKDVQRFSARVPVGGYVVLDDLSWEGGAVSESARWLQANGFNKCFRVQDWAVFQRVRLSKGSK